MSVKIRLARRGRKKLAMFDVVIADARAPRDGRFIEKIGTYNPNVNPAFININEQKALDWIMKGAQPTTTARAILSERGVMFKKHLQVGINKGAITQDHADKKFEDWFKDKEKQNQETLNKLTEASKRLAKTKFEAEKKVNENRAAAIMKKKQVAEAALVAEITEEEVTATDNEIVEEVEETISKPKGPEKVKGVKVEETKAEEAKAEEAKVEEAKAEEAKVDKTEGNDKRAESSEEISK
jgi:small subunit ribosomal protein S16